MRTSDMSMDKVKVSYAIDASRACSCVEIRAQRYTKLSTSLNKISTWIPKVAKIAYANRALAFETAVHVGVLGIILVSLKLVEISELITSDQRPRFSNNRCTPIHVLPRPGLILGDLTPLVKVLRSTILSPANVKNKLVPVTVPRERAITSAH
jgi:hypothetical protein